MNLILRRTARAVEVLAASLAVLALSAECGSAPKQATPEQGTLTGHFYAVGGPYPGSPQPYNVGTVTADGPDGRHTIPITSYGYYTIKLSVGTYTVTGTTPGYNGGKFACDGGTITVKRGQTSSTDIACSIR